MSEDTTIKLREWDEPMPLYAQSGAIESSLAECLDVAPQHDGAIIGVSVLGGVLIGAGLLIGGYQIGHAVGYAAGVVQPWIDARGWIAIVFLALGIPVYGIWYSNKKGFLNDY